MGESSYSRRPSERQRVRSLSRNCEEGVRDAGYIMVKESEI